MAMNTPYLSMNTSAQSNINTPHILTGLAGFSNFSSVGTFWCNDFVVRGAQTFTGAVTYSSTVGSASAASFGAITGTTGTFTSTLTAGGVVTATAGILLGGSVASPTSLIATGARFFSRITTASGTSLVNQDGEISVTNLSLTSCTLQYRSGNTTYTFRADAASVL